MSRNWNTIREFEEILFDPEDHLGTLTGLLHVSRDAGHLRSTTHRRDVRGT